MSERFDSPSPEIREALEPLAGEVGEATLRDFLSRMDAVYFSEQSVTDMREHIRRSASLSIERPAQISVAAQPDGTFTLTIIAVDHFGELSLLCGLLSSFGLDIRSGHIYTMAQPEPGKSPPYRRDPRSRRGLRRKADRLSSTRIVDVFQVQPQGSAFGRAEQDALERQVATVIAQLERGEFDRAREVVMRRLAERLGRASEAFTGILLPLDVRFQNEPSERWTRLDLQSTNAPAFLYAVSNALALRGVYIHRVVVESLEDRVTDRFFISDRHGQKIEGAREQETLRIALVMIHHFTYFLPRAPDPARASRYFDQFMDKLLDLEDRSGSSVLAFFEGQEQEELDMLARLLGSSDFLWEDFLRMRFDELLPLLQSLKQPAVAPSRAQISRELQALLSGTSSWEEARSTLNRFKDRQVFLIDSRHLLGMDLGLFDFSRALTDLAEAVLAEALASCRHEVQGRFGIPRDAAGQESPVVICGLGKLGGRELGYASDLELLFVFDGLGKTDGARSVDNGEYFEELARSVQKMIEARAEGTFQIDLRLRPHGRAGPLASTLDAMAGYYSPTGEAVPFERQALIKLRAVVGDDALGRRVEQLRDAFVYSDRPWDQENAIHLRTRQVRELMQLGERNVKYSPGGLVDIEYAVQYLQILNGPRLRELRTPNTLDALDQLRRHDLLAEDEHRTLHGADVFLRNLVDGLRVVRGNAKDLVLPREGSEEMEFLARRLRCQAGGWSEAAAQLARDIEHHMAGVRAVFGRRFVPRESDAAALWP